MFERSGYKAGYYPSHDPNGDPRLLIVVKRTWDIDVVEGKCKAADESDDILLTDRYNGDEDPFKSSVLVESDLAPWKERVDVCVVGKAYAPKGKAVPTFDVGVQVGRFKKSLRIFGKRTVTWVPPREVKQKKKDAEDAPPAEAGSKKNTILEHQPPLISDPEPIEAVELVYENAYGGFATFYPDNPAAFRKAIRKAKKKARKKQEEEAQKKAEEAAAAEEADATAAAREAEAEKERSLLSYFFHGVKDIKDAPDEELEVEIGSRKLKSRDGTVVLDLAELAEVEEREAEEEARRKKAEAEAAAAKAKKKRGDDGALIADEDDLAKEAAELTEDAEAEREAYEEKLRREGRDADGARAIERADRGDEVLADDDWIDEQKREREAFYASLGLDPDVEVVWEDGEFPRIPCPTNFVGRGFALGNTQESLDGLEMPLIEDPDHLLGPEDIPVDPRTLHLPTVPRPAGWSPLGRGWQPRAGLAGYLPRELEDAQHKMDKRLVEELDPDDEDDQATIKALLEREADVLDPRYYNSAPTALQLETLVGDEDVFLENLDPKGKTYFKLPASRPLVRFDRGDGWELVEVMLDTLVIDREKEQVHLVWRGHRPLSSYDELALWPRRDIDVQDMGVSEWLERRQQEELERRRRAGEALKLGVDEISDEEAAEFEQRIEQAGIGLHGVKEEKSTDARELRDEDGTLIDVQDREDVILHDDAWVEQAQLDLMSAEERLAAEMARDERLAVQEKKKALAEKMEAIEREKQEAAEAEAKQKKKSKKKQKKAEAPSEDDEDDDEEDADHEPAESDSAETDSTD